MFESILAFFGIQITRVSKVENAISGMNQIIADLHIVEDENDAEALVQEARVVEARAAYDAAIEEALKAECLRKKFEALVEA